MGRIELGCSSRGKMNNRRRVMKVLDILAYAAGKILYPVVTGFIKYRRGKRA